MKAVHVQLSNKRRDVGVLEIRPTGCVSIAQHENGWGGTYDRTFENSLEGDMTKLSFVLDHEMRCWMLWSSSMLRLCQYIDCISRSGADPLVEFMYESCLDDLGLLCGCCSAHNGRSAAIAVLRVAICVAVR